MALENLKAGVALLMEEIEKRPNDRHVLQNRLRDKISEFRAMGLPVPADLRTFEAQLEDDDADDLFDNMPI